MPTNGKNTGQFLTVVAAVVSPPTEIVLLTSGKPRPEAESLPAVSMDAIVTEKYARLGVPAVRADLDSTLRRPIAQACIQNLATAVGTWAQLKEEKWEYDIT